MPKYRKLSVVIEAVKFTERTKDQALNFVRCNCIPSFDSDGNPAIVIQTLEGDMTATLGDYIIRGVAGEFYPCKPHIFEATYEAVEDDDA